MRSTRCVDGVPAAVRRAVIATALCCAVAGCSGDEPADAPAAATTAADGAGSTEGRPDDDVVPAADDAGTSPAASTGSVADSPIDGGAGATGPVETDPLAVATAGPVSAIGLIVLNRAATLAGGTTTLMASFAELPVPREVDAVLRDFLPAPDTCTVERGRIDGLGGNGGADVVVEPLGTAPDGPSARSIGAGDALVFTSPAGTWATLPRRERDGYVGYASDSIELSLPVPAGLVVDVPGAEFPGFVAVPVPVVPPLTGLSPGPLEPVTSGTVFRWDVIEEPREVAIDVLGIDPDTLDTVSIGCLATDDGEFAFADVPGLELDDGLRGVAAAIRRGTELARDGDALLIVTGATAEAGAR